MTSREEQERERLRNESKGLKRFDIGGDKIWAINEKNAWKKWRKAEAIKDNEFLTNELNKGLAEAIEDYLYEDNGLDDRESLAYPIAFFAVLTCLFVGLAIWCQS